MESLTVGESHIASIEPRLIARGLGMSGPATKANMDVTFHESILKDKPFVSARLITTLLG